MDILKNKVKVEKDTNLKTTEMKSECQEDSQCKVEGTRLGTHFNHLVQITQKLKRMLERFDRASESDEDS